MSENYLLEMKNISKNFPGVKALDEVSLNLYPSEVLGLVGENGAGKSTLMNILNGVFPPDEGQIIVDGREVRFSGPLEAQRNGIAYIHQELNLIDELNIRENLFLGRELKKKFKLLDIKKMREQTRLSLKKMQLDVDPETLVGSVSLTIKQLIEISKALMLSASIIVMDEPTSSLTDEETEILFGIIEQLKTQGKGIIFISHRIEEIFFITDRVTVLRNGKLIGTKSTKETTYDELVEMMSGKEVEKRFFKESSNIKEEILLEVSNLYGGEILQDINFKLKKGEILGIAGLSGSGRTELLESIFGTFKVTKGEIRINGNKYRPTSPKKAINKGIAYLSEDRENKGLFPDFNVFKNIIVTKAEKDIKSSKVKKMKPYVNELINQLNIATPSLEVEIRNLSGGNKQKAILARWILARMNVLLVNEPTRGIDVSSKIEMYKLLYKLTKREIGIIVVSSELPELLAICDRILVMYEGRINACFDREEFNKETILKAMWKKSELPEKEKSHGY